MKSIYFLLTTLLMTVQLSSTAYAQTKVRAIPKLKTVKSEKVIFQSEKARYVKSYDLYKVKVATLTDTQNFKVSDLYFDCNNLNSKNKCRLTYTIERALFEYCQVQSEQLTCSDRIIQSESTSDNGSDLNSTNTNDYINRAEPDYSRLNSLGEPDRLSSESDYIDGAIDDFSDSGSDINYPGISPWETEGTVIF